MDRKNKTVTVHVNVDAQVIDNFNMLYPRCRSRFICNALRLATTDKLLFDRIFFCDIISPDENHVL